MESHSRSFLSAMVHCKSVIARCFFPSTIEVASDPLPATAAVHGYNTMQFNWKSDPIWSGQCTLSVFVHQLIAQTITVNFSRTSSLIVWDHIGLEYETQSTIIMLQFDAKV